MGSVSKCLHLWFTVRKAGGVERAWGRETPAPNNFFKGQRPWKLSECSAELTAGLATSQCSFMSPFRTAKVLKMKMLPAREISLLLTACAGEARHFTEGPRTKQTRLLNELSTPKPEAAEGLIKGAGKSRMKVSAEAKGKTLGEVKGKKILETFCRLLCKRLLCTAGAS